MNRARAVEKLVERRAVIALSTRLLDESDKVFKSAASKSTCSQGLLPVVTVTAVKAVLTIVIAVVSVISAPFIAALIITTWWTIRPGNPGDIFAVMQVSLLGVRILFSDCKHLGNRSWWLLLNFLRSSSWW